MGYTVLGGTRGRRGSMRYLVSLIISVAVIAAAKA
jgi:hypothetical protein